VLAATSSFRISQDTVYVPDLAVRCDPEDNDPRYIARPCVVVEVLSPSTESIDRREKAAAYRGIDSLLTYLIFSQDAMRVVRHWRETTSDPWQVMIHHRGDVPIPCMDAQLPLAEVYANILPPEEESSGGSAEEEQGDDRAEERHGR
jgi:Uma2 family endonuclease